MGSHDAEPSRKAADWVLGGLIPAILVGVPLLILPGGSFYFDITPKVVVLLLGTGVAALFWRGYGPGLEAVLGSRTGRWFVALVGVQAVSLTVSTVFSTQTPLSFAGTNWRRLGLVSHLGLLLFALVLLGWLLARNERWLVVLRATVVAGGLAGLYGIAQYFGVDPWLPGDSYRAAIGDEFIVRPPATLGHAGYFATYLLYAVFLAGALVRSDGPQGWRGIGTAVVIIDVTAIVLSGTRSAMLGLAVGGVVLLVWYKPRLTWRGGAAGAGIVAAGVLFLLSPAGGPLRNRVRWAQEDVTGGPRPALWRDSLSMAGEYWAFGAGPETYANTFPRFQSVELAQALPDSYYESPHNIFLDALTGQGVVGLAVLVLLAGFPVIAARQARAGGDVTVGFLMTSFVAGLVSQQFLVFTVPTALAFYVGAVLIVARTVRARAAPVPLAYRRVARVGALTASVLLLMFGGQLALADRAMEWARRRVEERNVLGALQAYGQVRRVQPWGMNNDIWLAQVMDLLANNAPDVAGRIAATQVVMGASLRAAEASDQRPNALYGVAAAHFAGGDHEAAAASLQETIEMAPHWYKPHLLLAQVFSEQGKAEQAIREAELALRLNDGADPEVRETLKKLGLVR